MIVATNTHDTQNFGITYSPDSSKEGTVVCNVFYPEVDCVISRQA
jgi:hypothetical protein